MNNAALENLLKEIQQKIAKFVDNNDVTVKITGCLFEVKSGPFTMFSYNINDGYVLMGLAHKVGFTPIQLYDFRNSYKKITNKENHENC